MEGLRDLLSIAEMTRRPLMIRGAAGVGKSAATIQHVESRRDQIQANPELRDKILAAVPKGSPVSKLPEREQLFGYVDIRLAYYDPTDIKGFPSIDKEAGVSQWLPPAAFPLQMLVDQGYFPQYGLITLEELASAQKSVQAAAFQMTLDHTINGNPLGSGWNIVATSNRLVDLSVVHPMPSPLVSRFSHCELNVPAGEWIDWALRNGIHHKLIAYFKFKPSALTSFDPSNWQQDTPYCCPRSAHILSDVMTAWESKFPGKPVPLHLITSCIGTLIGTEMFAHFDIYHSLPTIKEIEDNPDNARLPSEASAIFAITSALARHANDKNLSAIYRYIKRFDKSFEFNCVKDINRVHSELAQSVEFRDFINHPENKEIFLGMGGSN